MGHRICDCKRLWNAPGEPKRRTEIPKTEAVGSSGDARWLGAHFSFRAWGLLFLCPC